MFRRCTPMAALLLAGVLTATSPAQARCPGEDGTIPGSPASVTTVATPVATIYIDDRDAQGLDGEDGSRGLWLYLESNDTEGLQRGGSQVAFEMLADHGLGYTPCIQPIPTPIGVTLFPNGCMSQPWAEFVGMYDDCRLSAEPDTLLF